MAFEEDLEKGIELVEDEEYDESLEIAHKLQKMEPDSADGFHLQAIIMQHQQRFDESIKVLDKAIDNAPYDAGLYNQRGFAKMSTDKLDEARKDFEEAIELEDLEAAHRNLVLVDILLDKGNQAVEYLVTRIKENPKDVENWILMGDLMSKGGQKEKARGYYEQAQKMAPDNEYLKKVLDS